MYLPVDGDRLRLRERDRRFPGDRLRDRLPRRLYLRPRLRDRLRDPRRLDADLRRVERLGDREPRLRERDLRGERDFEKRFINTSLIPELRRDRLRDRLRRTTVRDLLLRAGVRLLGDRLTDRLLGDLLRVGILYSRKKYAMLMHV